MTTPSNSRNLPTGTVTLLFTDIEGSTQHLARLGDGYGDVLAEHRSHLREAFAAHGGSEVDSQGDSLFYAFTSAQHAVDAAAQAQTALANGPVRVRIGIHTGEPRVADEGYVGIDVHRAARIMAAGHGGQVLVSSATRGVLETDPGLIDLGEHRLKDLSTPIRLYQLGADEHPPLRTLHQTNLPVQANALIGRERELSDLAALVREHRVVTLVGPGGSGKTRLALQAAAEAVESFVDGVWWVPLTAVTDADRVSGAIAAAVGADGPLGEYLKGRRALLLIDNFEQVIAGAHQVAEVIESAPEVRALVTSREPLRIHGEHRYAVDPLQESDATTLFVERARAVDPGVSPDEVVVRICRRLDRLPLAVELAAARVGLLAPDELLARLDHTLPLLTAGMRDAPERQRTLRATIEWSHRLCSADERELFARLASFTGGWTLDAAAFVCESDLEALQGLVDKSLVRRWPTGRFGMLDTLREYTVELLDSSPDARSVRRRHAEYYLAVAVSAGLNAGLLRQGPMLLDIADAEQENIRAALAWAIDAGEVDLALSIGAAMEQFWVNIDPREGVRWFAAMFDMPGIDAAPADLRGHALRSFGGAAHVAGDPGFAEQLFTRSLALFEELGDEHGRAVLMHRLSLSAMVRGDLERARELVMASHEIHGRTGDVWGQAQTVGTLGAIERDSADDERARELIERSAELALAAGVRWWWGGMLAELAALALRNGRLDDAEAYARQSVSTMVELRDWPGRLLAVGLLAGIAAERGQHGRAGRLWGAIENDDAMAPLGGWRRHRPDCAARIERIRSPDLDRACAIGRGWTLDDAVDYALEDADG